MDLIQIVVLALVQGLTEFLPISSSAHLILVPIISEWEDQGLAFDVAVHAGTLIAVVSYFRKEIAKPKKYAWELENYNEDEDPFLKHFDENGNFIETVEPEIQEEQLNINYTYKEDSGIENRE